MLFWVNFFVRVFIILLFAFIFIDLSFNRFVVDRHLIFLIDSSRSIDVESRRFISDYLQDIIASNNKFTYSLISFASDARLSEFAQRKIDGVNIFGQDGDVDSDWSNGTNIESALVLASSLSDSGIGSEVVLFSDGKETAGDALSAAVLSGLPVSTVSVPELRLTDVSVLGFDVPVDLRVGESFNIDLLVYSNSQTDAVISIFRNEFKIVEVKKALSVGENRFRFRQVASAERLQEFSVKVESISDVIVENNFMRRVVLVGDMPVVLAIDSDAGSLGDFSNAMFEQGIRVEVRPVEGIPNAIDDFLQFDAVIISDVPAAAFSLGQMVMLRDYVFEFGGSLLMFGGGRSFGCGGYYGTAIEEILPVRCNFDDERDKVSAGISLTIDRSGSMDGEKLRLAKEAAKGAVKLMSVDDYISVIAFDAIPHVIVPAQKVTSQNTICGKINGIISGGGTNIYPALNESYEQLNWLKVSSKHIILLTDGKCDASEVAVLAKRIFAAGITVTIISIGEVDDVLLRRAAELGGGRYYRVSDPNAAIQIFASETMLMGKSPISEEPFVPVVVMKSVVLNGINVERFPFLFGFVRTKTKPDARTILAAGGGEPLLAWRRYGSGISMVFTSDVKNRWASEWLVWSDFQKFWGQVMKFAARRQKQDNSVIDCKFIDGGIEVVIDVAGVGSDDNFIDSASGFLTIITPELLKYKIPLEQVAAGRYRAIYKTKRRGSYKLQMNLQTKEQKTILQYARVLEVDYSDELRGGVVNKDKLRKIAELTGGNFNPNPAKILSKHPKKQLKNFSLRPYLFVTIIILFLIDLLLNRKKIR
ncbi:MAG: VWA domain-containing protein [Planctomycetaceae bacterium]|jgi:uncharacterized membrane protein|nr:VWA domain-containing protein [Planctomycetaceae bacterium]